MVQEIQAFAAVGGSELLRGSCWCREGCCWSYAYQGKHQQCLFGLHACSLVPLRSGTSAGVILLQRRLFSCCMCRESAARLCLGCSACRTRTKPLAPARRREQFQASSSHACACTYESSQLMPSPSEQHLLLLFGHQCQCGSNRNKSQAAASKRYGDLCLAIARQIEKV